VVTDSVSYGEISNERWSTPCIRNVSFVWGECVIKTCSPRVVASVPSFA
jgi:hypothetical protein